MGSTGKQAGLVALITAILIALITQKDQPWWTSLLRSNPVAATPTVPAANTPIAPTVVEQSPVAPGSHESGQVGSNVNSPDTSTTHHARAVAGSAIATEAKPDNQAAKLAELVAQQKVSAEAATQAGLIAKQKATDDARQVELAAKKKADDDAKQAELAAQQKVSAEAATQAGLIAKQKAADDARQVELAAKKKADDDAKQADLAAQQKVADDAKRNLDMKKAAAAYLLAKARRNHMGPIEYATNRNGGDIGGAVRASNVMDCVDLCRKNEACRSMTFGKGEGQPFGACWLKSIVPPPSASAAWSSAVKQSLPPL